MTLTEFLLARIAEDEAGARGDYDFDRPHWSGCDYFVPDHLGGGECACGYSVRVLAECEAKRRIVEAAHDRLGGPNWRDAIDYAMLEMAAVYVAHPDYLDEWKQ